MTSTIEKKHFDAAGEMVGVLAARLGKDRGVHSETAIAAAARMAGTMLFRSFDFDTGKMSPGAVVLSNEASEKGPELVNIVVSTGFSQTEANWHEPTSAASRPN